MGRTTRVAPGQRYRRLTVLERVDQLRWLCACDCGGTKLARSDKLVSGQTGSCGCLRPGHRTHGGFGTSTHNSWRAMIDRCYQPGHPTYARYGGRGITVCDRWRGRDGFANFLVDMGERPEGRSIDRVDNEGNYEPDNCRWATPKEQRANRRDSKRECGTTGAAA